MLESYTDLLRTVAKQFRPPSPLIPETAETQPPATKPHLQFAEVKELATQCYSQRTLARQP
jgi:hypothetical protein